MNAIEYARPRNALCTVQEHKDQLARHMAGLM